MDAVTLGMAKADARRQVTAASRRQLIPVASRARLPFNFSGPLSDGVVMGGTSRVFHTMTATAHGLILGFPNFYNNAGQETPGPNAITVSASVEIAFGVFVPVHFNGQASVTIQPGAMVYSDPVGVNLVKGATFWTRTHVTVASAGMKFPVALYSNLNGEGADYSATPVDKTASGTVTSGTTTHMYEPGVILGAPKVPGGAVILGVGDSIMAGSGDSGAAGLDTGWFLRAINNAYPTHLVAYASEAPLSWTSSSGIYSARRKATVERVGATHIVCEHGINGVSATGWQANIDALWAQLAIYGLPIYQTTLTPKTTSTDAWATAGNQAVSADEARRVAFNTYVRTTPSPLAGYIEVADYAETSRNSGIWRAAYTTDGLHPNATAAAAIAAAALPGSLQTTLFGAAPA